MEITNAKMNSRPFPRIIIIAILFFAMLLAYPTSVFACTIQDVCDIDGNCGAVNTCNALCNAINAPSSVVRGTTFSASMTFYNYGTETWSSANNHKLGSQSPQDNSNWGTNRISLPNSVNRYDFVTFSFTATAPNTAGTYTFAWQMLQEGNMFFGQTCTKQIQVIDPPPLASSCTSISAPSSVSRGSSFSASVTMRNDGNNIWTQSDNYRLGSQSPPDTSRWSITRVDMPYSVSFGSSVTFNFNAVAPSDPGTTGCSPITDSDTGIATGEHNCPFAWQMTQSGAYFGNTCSTSITVGCVDECPNGQSRCNGNFREYCSTSGDADPCTEWTSNYCNQGCQVTNGVANCITCSNECSYAGWYDCIGSTAYYCGQCDTDPCVERCNPQTCSYGCSSSTGCLANPCNGVVCTAPPDTCVTSTTLRDYRAGVCNNGVCSSPPYTDITCQYGCLNGACSGISCPGDLGSCTVSTPCSDSAGQRDSLGNLKCPGWYCRAGAQNYGDPGGDGWVQQNDQSIKCDSSSDWCKKIGCDGQESYCVTQPNYNWVRCASGCDVSSGTCKSPECKLTWSGPTTSTGEGIREIGVPCVGPIFNVQILWTGFQPNTNYLQRNIGPTEIIGHTIPTDANGNYYDSDTSIVPSNYLPGYYRSEVLDTNGIVVKTCDKGFYIQGCSGENEPCCRVTCGSTCAQGLWCHQTCTFDQNNYFSTIGCGHCCKPGWIWNGVKCIDYFECSPSSPAPLNIGPNAPPCTSGQVCCPNQKETGYGYKEPDCLLTGTGIQPY